MRSCGESSPPRTLLTTRAIALLLTAAACAAVLTLRVSPAGALTLPENRAWELVSPPVNGVNVEGQLTGLPFRLRASPDGRRLFYPNTTPLPGTADPAIGFYVADRDQNGWNTLPVGPEIPVSALNGEQALIAWGSAFGIPAYSEDIEAFVYQSRAPLVEENHREAAGSNPYEQNFDLYARTLEAPSWNWFTKPLEPTATNENIANVEGVSGSGSSFQVVYTSEEPQDPLYPTAHGSLYLWRAGDPHATLIGQTEAGEPIAGAQLGAALLGTQTGSMSRDGSRIAYEDSGQSDLYVRVGEHTIHVAGGGGVFFMGSADDTRRLYFTAAKALPGTSATTGGLYAYDVPIDGNPAHGHLEYVDHTGAWDVLAVPPEGGDLYYVKVDEEGTPRLYDYSEKFQNTRYVATLSPEDGPSGTRTWDERDVYREARTSSDGNVLVFASRADGIGGVPYANGGFSEIFRYEASSGKPPVCISCLPAGSTSTSNAVLSYHGTPLAPHFMDNGAVLQRNVSADGRRIFFQTEDRLVPEDTNEAADVYEWVNGSPHLISAGEGEAGSLFLDASASGGDVFFRSFDNLDPRKTDGSGSIYDARVGGTPFSPPAPPAQCEGEACQQQQVAPVPSEAGSAAFHGDGNEPPVQDCSNLSHRAHVLQSQARRLERKASALRQQPARARHLKRQAAQRRKEARHLAEQAKACKRGNRGVSR